MQSKSNLFKGCYLQSKVTKRCTHHSIYFLFQNWLKLKAFDHFHSPHKLYICLTSFIVSKMLWIFIEFRLSFVLWKDQRKGNGWLIFDESKQWQIIIFFNFNYKIFLKVYSARKFEMRELTFSGCSSWTQWETPSKSSSRPSLSRVWC